MQQRKELLPHVTLIFSHQEYIKLLEITKILNATPEQIIKRSIESYYELIKSLHKTYQEKKEVDNN